MPAAPGTITGRPVVGEDDRPGAGPGEPAAVPDRSTTDRSTTDRRGEPAVFQLIWIVIAGLIVGGLAQLILPGRSTIPLWLTAALGIAGALIGNIIAGVIGVRHTGGVDWVRHALQVGAAVALIIVVAPLWSARSSRQP